mmetsp:Transcript_3888/g.9853  ORF Transcript_3888/g.9853 Transcript_3888/m.9853 type:complete len:262 (+) Transcript_3888:2923-3708(+)
MANIAQHTARYISVGINNQIGDGAIECGNSQPCFRWQLQRATKEVTNDIAMSDNDFKFVFMVFVRLIRGGVGTTDLLIVMFLRFILMMMVAIIMFDRFFLGVVHRAIRFDVVHGIRTVYVFLKGRFNSTVVRIDFPHSTNVWPDWNHWSRQGFIQHWIRFFELDMGQMRSNDTGRFFGTFHIAGVYALKVTRTSKLPLHHSQSTTCYQRQPLARQFSLMTTQWGEFPASVILVPFIVLSVSNEEQVTSLSQLFGFRKAFSA